MHHTTEHLKKLLEHNTNDGQRYPERYFLQHGEMQWRRCVKIRESLQTFHDSYTCELLDSEVEGYERAWSV